MKYDFSKIEKKWQKFWLENKTFKSREDSKKPKYYQLETFPYPSGAGLHVGHPKGYIAEDIHARFMRMKGSEVLYTMGWDAFGLPTENYAIQVGKSPKEVAEDNVKNFKRQVQLFGLSYDWDREINTSHPDYYQWTQWIFLELYKKGLAYRAKARVNWCPKDQTVLANEQVINGRCERCDSIIEQREMEQWFFKITDYADRLLEDLKGLDWPSSTIKRQEDWIGRSEGAELDFPLEFEKKSGPKPNYLILHGYTGRADKNFIPWLKEELEQHGFEVQAPQMPNTDSPKESEQVNYVIDHCTINERTVIVGHSLGAVVGIKVLQKINKPIAGLVLVAPAVEPKFRTGEPRPFWKTFTWDYDYEKIKELTNFRVILSDNLEKEKREAYLEYLAQKINAPIKKTTAQKDHFRGKQELFIFTNVLPHLTVFTTRPDTLFGATYMVLAPEHPLLANGKLQIANRDEVDRYIEMARHKTELQRQEEIKDKTGVELKGVKAINPATKEEIPIWIADYVLMGYGTGAIMAVPAHDERDAEFAKKFNLPIQKVIQPPALIHMVRNARDLASGVQANLKVEAECWTGEGELLNSGKFDGMESGKAKWEITKFVGGQKKIQYKIRDWSVSRQRYWGAPIPIIYCDTCGIVPVPEKELPVVLPELKNYRPKGVPPLASSKEFINVKCPKCGGEARRDAETLDTFVDSSWYYLTYAMQGISNFQFPISNYEKAINHWMPVDLYVIGAEHTVLHLLYSRFITKFLYDKGFLKCNEPFVKLRHQGLILGEDGQKMSKSKGNVVNPDSVVKEFGVDALRLYEMFMGPFEDGAPWDTRGITGVERFLNRVWSLIMQNAKIKNQNDNVKLKNETTEINRLLHKTIKKVTEDIENLKFNTAISALMILLSNMEKQKSLSLVLCHMFLKILHPFAPHLTQELWSVFGNTTILDFEPWPDFDPKLIQDETFTLVIQVNGKVRDSVEVPADISEPDARELALGREKVKSFLSGKTPSKVIYISKKLVSIVV